MNGKNEEKISELKWEEKYNKKSWGGGGKFPMTKSAHKRIISLDESEIHSEIIISLLHNFYSQQPATSKYRPKCPKYQGGAH